MRFRICITSLVMILILIWSCKTPAKFAKFPTPPNIVFILVDDLGYADVYNLKNDIGETDNLSASYPERTEQLLLKLKQWLERVDAEMPIAN